MHNFEKLKIWQKAMDVAVHVYEISTFYQMMKNLI